MSINFQDQIRDRLRNGFKNWNGGYESWLKWCDTLYEPDAHYNVYGRRLTLQEYKDMMGQFFSAYDVELGEFYNMLVIDDWCAIRYSVHVTNKATGESFEQMSFEFVNFKENPDPVGARVIEGWAVSDKPLSQNGGKTMDQQTKETNTLYLVTGVAGNLGSSVAAKLLEEGKKVRGLVLEGDPAAARVPSDVEICVGDVTDPESLERFFTADSEAELIVIHCAAIVTLNPGYSQKVYDVNVSGTRNILDACTEYNVRKLVYVSSTGAIPEMKRGTPITEVDRFEPRSVVGFYGKSKAHASQEVLDTVRERGLDASLVFPTGICGPDDYAFGPVASFIIDYCAGKMSAGIAGSFNAVDVRDLADAIVACCEKGRMGESYILGNECVSMREMFHLISSFTGAKEVRLILPAYVAKLVGLLSDLGERLTGKPARMTSYAVYNLTRNILFDCSKARKELDFHTRPFEKTIADTIDWLRRENKIEAGKEHGEPPFVRLGRRLFAAAAN